MFERVYETAPAFRAEPHDTGRHLSQFFSLDAELGFIDDHRDVMAVVREAVAGMVTAIEQRCPATALPTVPAAIPDIDFLAAQALLSAATGEDLTGEPDLAPAHERWLSEWSLAEHGSEFLFVTGYPMVKRPFYTHPTLARPELSNSFDLLFRGLELVTGGQRLHLHDEYLAALERSGQDPEPYAGYLQAFKYGMPPAAGLCSGSSAGSHV